MHPFKRPDDEPNEFSANVAPQKQPSLDDIGLRYGTDKSSLGHDYLTFYETYFAPLRRERITILEIGVLNGQSLRTWADYFENAKIVGVDIRPMAKAHATDRITIEIADQSNVQHLANLALKHGPFDIVIEDGSHRWEHQITTLRTLFPFVTSAGFYAVEDLHTNYGDLDATYKGVSSITCVEYLKRWQDLLVADQQIKINEVEDAFLRTFGRKIKSMVFCLRACLIQKNWFEPIVEAADVLADSTKAASLPVTIVAHISFIGDVTVENGCVNHVKKGGERRRFFEIQGFTISTGLNLLEYKVQFLDGEWTDWAGENAFVGSRHQSRLLRGVAVRARSDLVDRYAVRTVGLFRQAPAPLVAMDGAEISVSPDFPLYGLQVDVTERGQ